MLFVRNLTIEWLQERGQSKDNNLIILVELVLMHFPGYAGDNHITSLNGEGNQITNCSMVRVKYFKINGKGNHITSWIYAEGS